MTSTPQTETFINPDFTDVEDAFFIAFVFVQI
jgi:hypothetical protein